MTLRGSTGATTATTCAIAGGGEARSDFWDGVVPIPRARAGTKSTAFPALGVAVLCF